MQWYISKNRIKERLIEEHGEFGYKPIYDAVMFNLRGQTCIKRDDTEYISWNDIQRAIWSVTMTTPSKTDWIKEDSFRS